NGALCAAYIVVSLRTLNAGPAPAWFLLAAVVAAWLWIVFRRRVRSGIAIGEQRGYAVICTVGGVIVVGAVHFVLDVPAAMQGQTASDAFAWQFVANVIENNQVKIGLFAIGLGAFLANERFRT